MEQLLAAWQGAPSASNELTVTQSTVDGGPHLAEGDEALPCLPKRYQFVRLLGRGGMGRVWLVRDLYLHREVVLKELRPDRVDIPQASRRLLNEARITGRLQHRGIVPVYDLIPTPHGLFYTMVTIVSGSSARR